MFYDDDIFETFTFHFIRKCETNRIGDPSKTKEFRLIFYIWFNRNEIHQIDTFMRECETFNNLCNHFIHVAFESRQVIIKIEMLTITFARESCDCVARWILNCFGNSFNLFFFSSIRLWISWKQAKIMSSLYAAAIIWYNKDLLRSFAE